ncbi:hypothetical protein [Methanoculleus sp.]|jgi:hypothetical protein|uniref:hypothetical protein n=1 Tax=Methanoculleus sp. TaxID=90427 RepID=UPI001BD3D967|nr:hypothetical protein [Methanoculleus sp.]
MKHASNLVMLAREDATVQVDGSSFVPERLPFSEDLLDDLNLPEGFEEDAFARNLTNSRIVTVGDDTNGVIYRASCAGANNTTNG